MQALADMDNIVVAGSAGDDIGKQCGGWTITWQGATGNTTPGTTIFSGLKAAMDKKGGTISYNANGVFSIRLIVLISLAGNFNCPALRSPLLSAYGSSPTTTIAASTLLSEFVNTPLAL